MRGFLDLLKSVPSINLVGWSFISAGSLTSPFSQVWWRGFWCPGVECDGRGLVCAQPLELNVMVMV